MQYADESLYVFFRAVYVVVYCKFVAYAVGGLAQQSVVVERTDDIFHYLLFLFRQVYVHHLLFQLVVE